jgi:hypothetical protein
VYHLLDSFLDPTVTENDICRVYELTAQQVAAARAFVLRNPDTVLAKHLQIEAKLAAGNPPHVREAAEAVVPQDPLERPDLVSARVDRLVHGDLGDAAGAPIVEPDEAFRRALEPAAHEVADPLHLECDRLVSAGALPGLQRRGEL